MRKVVNKKGQGLSTTTLVLLILAGIVLVVVVLGFTKGWGYVFDKFSLLPDDLTSAAAACKTYAGSGGLALSYCQYRELTIKGDKQLVNCNYIHDVIGEVLGTGSAEFSKQDCNINAKSYCTQLKSGDNYKDKTIVNGESCKDLGVPQTP